MLLALPIVSVTILVQVGTMPPKRKGKPKPLARDKARPVPAPAVPPPKEPEARAVRAVFVPWAEHVYAVAVEIDKWIIGSKLTGEQFSLQADHVEIVEGETVLYQKGDEAKSQDFDLTFKRHVLRDPTTLEIFQKDLGQKPPTMTSLTDDFSRNIGYAVLLFCGGGAGGTSFSTYVFRIAVCLSFFKDTNERFYNNHVWLDKRFLVSKSQCQFGILINRFAMLNCSNYKSFSDP